MSDLSRLLDEVYQNGAATPPPAPAAPGGSTPAAAAESRPATAPGAHPAAAAPSPAPPRSQPAPVAEPEPVAEVVAADDGELPWESSTSLDEAFADWVPGPGADSPEAERELFELAGDEPAPPARADRSVLDHVFADEPAAPAPAPPPVTPQPVAQQPVAPAPPVAQQPVAPAAPPAPQPVAQQPVAPAAPHVGEDSLTGRFGAELDEPVHRPAPAPRTGPAYEPPATLADALAEAPDAPPTDLLAPSPDVVAAGLADLAGTDVVDEPAAGVHDGALTTSWRREDDDLLPSRGRRRR